MSENSHDDNSSTIKDRRRVDEFGQDRAVSADQAEPNFSLGQTAEPATSEPEINFVSFIVPLATQALMQMGQMPPPPGIDLKVDKQGARQTIEILSMLEQKTKGNLAKDEADLIEEVLHNLRLSFLKM